MSFAWPWALLALLLVPAIPGFAWWMRRRRRRNSVRIGSVMLVRSAMPERTRWRRRVPPALLLLGLVVLGVGVARPQASVPIAADSTTIMLAMDVSSSMCSTDMEPNRLVVAQRAATSFVEAQAGDSRIGLVAFASIAGLLVPPSSDTGAVLDAIDGLTTSRGTAIGQAILTSLDAIAEIDPAVAPTGAEVHSDGDPATSAPEAIVVLTDGANTTGVDPLVAAQQAADRDVRVYTIGFGTTTPAPMVCDSSQVGSGGGFGGGGARGGRSPLTIDEAGLQQIAEATGGEYYRAENATQLQEALAALPRTIIVARETIDIASWFAAPGGLLVAAAVGLSLWWSRARVLPSEGGMPSAGREGRVSGPGRP